MTNPICFCKHAAHVGEQCQAKDCECKKYQPRPCTCHHPYNLHKAGGRCQDKACNCRHYEADTTAEFLLRMGVGAKEWQFITTAQLQFIMRPEQDPTIRVWACGMVHSIGQRNRLAVKTITNADGKKIKVALQPSDIVEELNKYSVTSRMDVPGVRRAMAELERNGAARRFGNRRKNIKLYFYAKPLSSRSVPAELELVEPDEEAGSCDLVGEPDYQIFPSDSKEATSEFNQFLSIQRTFVKRFKRSLEVELNDRGVLVGEPDYQKIVDETVDELVLVVRSAYQRLVLMVCPDHQTDSIHKEDSISSIKGMQAEQSPAAAHSEGLPACSNRMATLQTGLDPLFPGELTPKVLQQIDARLDGSDIQGFIGRVIRRYKRKSFGPGLLPMLADEEAKYQKRHPANEPAPALTEMRTYTGSVYCEHCDAFTVQLLPDGSRGECSTSGCPSRQNRPGRVRTGTEG